jgi:hypothetical protein
LPLPDVNEWKSRMSGGNNACYGNILKGRMLPNKGETLFTSSTYQHMFDDEYQDFVRIYGSQISSFSLR